MRGDQAYMDLIVTPRPRKYNFALRDGGTRQMGHLRMLAQGKPISWHWHNSMQVVDCAEHHRQELVPTDNMLDVRCWYDAKRHPRWSLVKVLLEQKQRYYEIMDHLSTWRTLPEMVEARNKALATAPTPKQFIERYRPHLFVWITHQGRRVRVRQGFATKHKAKQFTAQDWLTTTNHEERRMMMRRGVEPADVLHKLGTPVAQDAEGTLYQYRGQRWLHVQCPSTQEHYLLAVPSVLNDRRYDSEKRAWTEPTQLNTPAKARRWTFNLPLDAEFVAEA